MIFHYVLGEPHLSYQLKSFTLDLTTVYKRLFYLLQKKMKQQFFLRISQIIKIVLLWSHSKLIKTYQLRKTINHKLLKIFFWYQKIKNKNKNNEEEVWNLLNFTKGAKKTARINWRIINYLMLLLLLLWSRGWSDWQHKKKVILNLASVSKRELS